MIVAAETECVGWLGEQALVIAAVRRMAGCTRLRALEWPVNTLGERQILGDVFVALHADCALFIDEHRAEV